MAYIRFLDNKDRVCQVNSPEDPILIVLDEKEHEMLKGAKPWQPLALVGRHLTEEEQERIIHKLNTTKNPVVIKG